MDNTHWNPGGWAAKRKGCTCPRLENRDGEGSIYDLPLHGPHQYLHHEPTKVTFVINLDCPLHADIARYSPAGGQDHS